MTERLQAKLTCLFETTTGLEMHTGKSSLFCGCIVISASPSCTSSYSWIISMFGRALPCTEFSWTSKSSYIGLCGLTTDVMSPGLLLRSAGESTVFLFLKNGLLFCLELLNGCSRELLRAGTSSLSSDSCNLTLYCSSRASISSNLFSCLLFRREIRSFSASSFASLSILKLLCFFSYEVSS